MNQRITKLVRQALNECVSTPVESVIASRIDDHGIVEIPNTFAEKFAELIVQECCEQVEQAKHSPFVSLDDAKRMQHFVNVTKKKITKHLGVGE